MQRQQITVNLNSYFILNLFNIPFLDFFFCKEKPNHKMSEISLKKTRDESFILETY